jgi:tripartite ATP-independent transporter DctP family solute receptor
LDYRSRGALAGTPAPAKREKLTFKLGHEGSEAWQGNQLVKRFAENAAKASSGQIEIQIFPSGQIGKSRDLMEGMQFGTVDMAVVGGEAMSFFPDFDVLSAPFLFRDRDHFKKTMAAPIGERLRRGWEEKGFKYLCIVDIGIRHVTNNQKAINTAADLKGLKMRVVPSQVFLETFKALGSTTVPIPFADLYVSLQQNVVDGQENPTTTIRVMKYYEVQKYLSLTAHMLSTSPVLMSLKRWQELAGDVQKVLIDAAAEAERWEHDFMLTDESKSLEFLKTEGKMIVNIPTDPQSFVEATKVVTQKLRGNIPALAEQIRAVR